MRPSMIIVASPSGGGKSSFLERALVDFPSLVDTVTFTTRAMRATESEGHPYHFVTKQKFEDLIGINFFVEWAEVHGNLYGTPRHQIDDAVKAGRVVIMDVDVQGARTFKQKYKDSVSIFIVPPSLEELKRRLLKRDGSSDVIAVRLKNAERELAAAPEFDIQIVNDDFEQSYSRFKKLVEEILNRS